MSAADTAWAVCAACWCAATVLLGLHVYELHRSARPVQVLSVSALGTAAAITAIVLNLTT